MDAALARGRERGLRGDGPFRPSFIGGLMTRSMEAGGRRKFRTTAGWTPAAGSQLDPQDVVSRLEATHDAIERLLREAEGLNLGRIRMSSPASRLIRMNLADAFALLLAHERRHLAQAQRVRAAARNVAA